MKEMNDEVISDAPKRTEPRTLEEFLVYEEFYCRLQPLTVRGQRVLTPRQRARMVEVHGQSYLG